MLLDRYVDLPPAGRFLKGCLSARCTHLEHLKGYHLCKLPSPSCSVVGVGPCFANFVAYLEKQEETGQDG
jgi:hypothetical protein